MLQWTLTRQLLSCVGYMHMFLTAQTGAQTGRRVSWTQTCRALCIGYTPFMPTSIADKLALDTVNSSASSHMY